MRGMISAVTGTGRANRPGSSRNDWPAVLLDAAIITVCSSCFGLVVNLFHPESIPYIPSQEYETLVPCPVPGGEVAAIDAADPVILQEDTLLVDARTRQEFEKKTVKGAMNITYDYLEPTPSGVLAEMVKRIAAAGTLRVVVFGDGDEPDTGEQLAREISARGIKNVMFVKGGAPALMKVVPETRIQEAGR